MIWEWKTKKLNEKCDIEKSIGKYGKLWILVTDFEWRKNDFCDDEGVKSIVFTGFLR